MTTKPSSGFRTLARGLSLVLVLTLLAALEAGARLLGGQSHLDQILGILEQHPSRFWRQRGLLSTGFSGTRVCTDRQGFRTGASKEPDTQDPAAKPLRIACLGGSPTFGWGVDHSEAYPAQLQRMLREDGTNAHVINGGFIGYTSHQGKILLREEILAMKPDLITVNFVINDIDKYRFYRTDGRPDRELEPRPGLLLASSNLLERSRFVALYGRLIRSLMETGAASFEGRAVAIYRPGSLRVPPDDYAENLSEIIEVARSNGIGVILIKFPVNLPAAPEVTAADRIAAEGLLARGKAMIEARQWAEAAGTFKEVLGHDPWLSEAHYLLGVCARRMGDDETAKLAFDRLMKSEAQRCGRDGLAYNAIMDRVAREKGVKLVDAVKAFAAQRDQYLFISPASDPIHPNRAGHSMIARDLRAAVAEYLRDLH
jgi:lysophospholipase L1-like esterase